MSRTPAADRPVHTHSVMYQTPAANQYVVITNN